MTGPRRTAHDTGTIRDRGAPWRAGGVRRVLAVLGLAVAALLATALPASAHATLTSSSPVGGAALDTAPDRVTLSFSESVSIKSDAIRVLDATGTRVDEGDTRGGGSASEVTVALRRSLGPGTYVVSWRVVSADSHPVGGAFAFGVGGPPDAGAAAAVPSGGGGSRAVGVSLGVARLVAFAGAALLIGATFFVGVLWPAGARRSGPVRLIAAGWLLSLAGALGMLLFQGPYSAGSGMSDVLSLDPLAVTLDSRYGQLLAIRVLALLLAVPLLRRLPVAAAAAGDGAGDGAGERAGRRGLVELAGLGLVLATTMAMIGHASAGDRVWLATAVMTVHTVAMAIWLGGLCVLGLALLDGSARSTRAAHAAGGPAESSPAGIGADLDPPVEPGWAGELARVLPRWSRTATIAIALIVLTGTVQAWREVGAFGALFDTTYGRLLLYKLWFVLGVLGLGLLARRWVRRHFQSTSAAPVTSLAVTGLRRGVVFEIIVGAAVLAVTSVLVNTVPGRDSYAPPFSRTAVAGPLTVDVEVAPTRTGLQTIHVYTYDPQGRPQRLVEASGELTLPSAGVGPLEVPLAEVTDGHAVAEGVGVPLPGEWQLRFTLRVNDFDQYVTTVFYTVR
ncbi:copper resistance protein CopC [Parafrankia colletiae]|uniref:Copper resistance protein CopC n=1 Tax=Parafrankia colletiae TaxID=573497 RepID=A0A1S1QXN5_9ACTN|nr:copper resistance protein CopC [Parafrankia colletiae]MCK9898798.1 copper resistance protein CopC/CopD [Frankia sp. Cpl3]OHV38376.1 copper resistance protein CopC [Parafrankia colletiae]